jgi:hypothetical protein
MLLTSILFTLECFDSGPVLSCSNPAYGKHCVVLKRWMGKGNGNRLSYHQVETLHIGMSRIWHRFRREEGWNKEKYFTYSAAVGVACGKIIGVIVTSNKSARVNRVNECLNRVLRAKHIVCR